jgi:predicted dehydrogenase
MEKTGFAIIGCGGRIQGLMQLLNLSGKVKLVGAWDPIRENTQTLLKKCRAGNARIYESYEELIQDENVAWVIVGSPNSFHAEHIIASFQAGKHVFSEKPLAVTMEDCKNITDAHRKTDLLFATGFTLRYASIYRKVKKILAAGKLGKIISISADENIKPVHGTYIMTNWRRKKELSGSHILEKCVHDLDLLNWFCESVPERISAVGGNMMYIEENRELFDKYPRHFGESNWGKGVKEFIPGGDNPFTIDKDIEDHVSALMTYKNGIKVTFQATTSNTIPERRMYFHCTEGNLIVELYSGIIKHQSLKQYFPRFRKMIGGGHGDGDLFIIRELKDSMINGTKPVCSGNEGLLSAAVAAGIDLAREKGEIIDMKDIWEYLINTD